MQHTQHTPDFLLQKNTQHDEMTGLERVWKESADLSAEDIKERGGANEVGDWHMF